MKNRYLLSTAQVLVTLTFFCCSNFLYGQAVPFTGGVNFTSEGTVSTLGLPGRLIEVQRTAYQAADDLQNFAINSTADFSTLGGNSSNAENWNTLLSYEVQSGVTAPAGVTLPNLGPGAAVLFVHGGGWTSGAATTFFRHAGELASLGVRAFSTNYGLRIFGGQLAPNDRGQYAIESVQDVREAIRFLRSNAAELGFDPDKLYIAGGSAGGHLAILATLGANPLFDAPGADTSISIAVSGHLLFNPVIQTNGSMSFPANESLLEDFYEDIPDFTAADVSPDQLQEVIDGLETAILLNGDMDGVTPLPAAQAFATAVNANDSPGTTSLEVVVFPGEGHSFFDNTADISAETTSLIATVMANDGALLTTLGADLNSDGVVDGADLALLESNLGATTPITGADGLLSSGVGFPNLEAYFAGDLNLDGFIDGADIAILNQAAGITPDPPQVVFSNDFEDGDLTPEVGSMTLVADSSISSVVPVTGGADATLGTNVALFDQNITALDLTLNLSDTVSLANGNTVSIDFDVATRRSNGTARTVFVTALDSNGAIVARLVLGDFNAFGNGSGDRQRPGFANSNGSFAFGDPPGDFWWGGDASPSEFDANRDAHMSLTLGASRFAFASTSQGGANFSANQGSNFDTVVSADVAEIRLTSAGPLYGMYFDNFEVQGFVDGPAVLLGDIDLNGIVDFLDIPAFIAVLTSGIFQAEADIDSSGGVDFLDIPAFIAILTAQ